MDSLIKSVRFWVMRLSFWVDYRCGDDILSEPTN
jgi:hypothetical protein